MKGFQKALQEYENRMFAPFDYLPLTDEEIEEIEDYKDSEGDRLFEEMRIKESKKWQINR